MIEKVPKHANLLKEIMSKRMKIKVGEQVEINASCSVIISQRIPQKLKDPGNFTNLIKIRKLQFNKALCDLSASINLMPLSIFEKLRSGDLRNTQVALELVDRSFV